MPIYEYECAKCGTFEATQRISDKPLTRCPTCKGKVKKLISNTSFQLKGTGWYITDYARKDKSSSEKSSAEKSSGSSTASKTDSPAKTDNGKKDSTEKSASKPAASESAGS